MQDIYRNNEAREIYQMLCTGHYFKRVQNLVFWRPPHLASTNFSYSMSITCIKDNISP